MMTIREFVSDNRGRIEVAIFFILAFSGLCLMTQAAHAEPVKMVNFSDMQYNPNITITATPVETTQQSYVVVETPTPTPVMMTPVPYPTNVDPGRRIDQGECVAIGETIDIAGLGWYTGDITYYGRYYDGISGDNASWQAVYSVDYRNLTNFYVEPEFFKYHTGYWYIDTYLEESHGNTRLFKVAQTCVKTPKENQTVIQEAINQSKIFMEYAKNKSALPVKYEPGYDFIISKNVTTPMNSPNGSKSAWVFGINTPDKFYDMDLPYDIIRFNKEDTVNLPEGQYDVFFINPGRNGIIEETYDRSTKTIVSPFRSQEDIPTIGVGSRLVESMLETKISESYDDSVSKWKIILQDPSIQIMKIDQMPLSNNHSYIVIAGYTNANAGDYLNIQFDADRINPNKGVSRNWEAVVVDPMGMNAYRIWNVSFIMDFNMIPMGQHSFTVTSKDGASATVPIYRRAELAGHYIPPEEMGFFSNSPFIPTPTPQVIKEIEKVQITVIQTITIPVTPSQESVNNAWWNGMLGVIGIVSVLALAGYVLLAGVRSRQQRRPKY
ncbi:MAG: hypothetical protein PHC39_04525 [Proteiniphilum sp.]|nr:hypothetical protein [Proteiniphilum sp.]